MSARTLLMRWIICRLGIILPGGRIEEHRASRRQTPAGAVPIRRWGQNREVFQ